MKDKAGSGAYSGKKDSSESLENKSANEAKHEEIALPDAETAEADPVVKMEVELSEYKDKYLRLYSEFENYKKRVARERSESLKFATIDTYLTFLPVIDDIERAQKSIEDAKDVDSVRQGVQLIYQKLKSSTEMKGLKPMLSIGADFDPELHDAISNVPAPTDDLKGKVIDEIEKGYFLNDRVIRHAKVIVGN